MLDYDCFKLGVHIFLVTLKLVKNVPTEIFNILFESTHNKQQYGTKITCTEVRGKKLW